jgi:hypothetical protein
MKKIINWYGRMPTVDVTVNLFRVLSPLEIRTFRNKIFRYLKRHGIESVVSVELTTQGKYKTPNNRIHWHFLLGDPRSEQHIIGLFHLACYSAGLIRGTFKVRYKKLPKPKSYLDYFTKTGKHANKVILFRRSLFPSGRGIQKFYILGLWFKKQVDGRWVRKSKKEIWNELIEHMRNKEQRLLSFDD